MKKFEFSNNDLSFEICGNTFTGDAAIVELEISAAQKKILEFAAKIRKGEAEKAEIEDCIKFTIDKLDKAFGKGTSEAIFKDRAISLHDCLDVVVYIIAVANEFEENKQADYDNLKGNRETRRANK